MESSTRASKEAIEAEEEENWRKEENSMIGKNWIEYLTQIVLIFQCSIVEDESLLLTGPWTIEIPKRAQKGTSG
jgi:hypothetical protein